MEAKHITIIENFLTKEECDVITKKVLKENKLEKATVHNDTNIERINETRKSKVSFVDDIGIIKNKIEKEVYKNIVELNGYRPILETFQFTKYEVGDYFHWHNDSGNSIYKDRMYTLVIQLNDDYAGGEFEIMIEKEISLKKGIGNLYLFPSVTLHRVRPVKDGIRYSLVSWLKLEKTENYKKSLL